MKPGQWWNRIGSRLTQSWGNFVGIGGWEYLETEEVINLKIVLNKILVRTEGTKSGLCKN